MQQAVAATKVAAKMEAAVVDSEEALVVDSEEALVVDSEEALPVDSVEEAVAEHHRCCWGRDLATRSSARTPTSPHE